ncbi:hypothetical protein [Streptomyces gossypiisoli]|uniref:hypothetical protein n=1 Tax=Streptomyces gossypiisoli TaxID=2748864 RepID=UPI0015DB3679|nr:hypothetical protein [Streptomyces gossypiisoli]
MYLLPTWCYFLWNLRSQSPGVHDQGEASHPRQARTYSYICEAAEEADYRRQQTEEIRARCGLTQPDNDYWEDYLTEDDWPDNFLLPDTQTAHPADPTDEEIQAWQQEITLPGCPGQLTGFPTPSATQHRA